MSTVKTPLDADFERLEVAVMKVKRDRDTLYRVCKDAYQMLDNVYDVDEPTPGHHKEHPFSGAGLLLQALRGAIQQAEGEK
jgi:hypothetical protein